MSAEHIETVIADLRRTHAQLVENAPSQANSTKIREWSMRLTVEEVGALLAIVDERDELRRQTVGDLETPFAPVRVEKSPFIEALNRRLEPIDQVVERIVGGGPKPITGHVEIPTLTDEEKVTINTCPHAGTHHSCPLGGCPSFERREVVPPLTQCDHREARFTGRCVKHLGHDGKHLLDRRAEGDPRGPLLVTGREARETPPEEWIFDDTRHTWLCAAPTEQCSPATCACGCHSTTNRTRMNGWMPADEA